MPHLSFPGELFGGALIKASRVSLWVLNTWKFINLMELTTRVFSLYSKRVVMSGIAWTAIVIAKMIHVS